MAVILKDVEAQALKLSPRERGSLIHRLILSLEGPAEDAPEEIASAWDEEITGALPTWKRDAPSAFPPMRYLPKSMALSANTKSEASLRAGLTCRHSSVNC